MDKLIDSRIESGRTMGRDGLPHKEYTVVVFDTQSGKDFMTFKTTNVQEAHEMGPRLIAFLGY